MRKRLSIRRVVDANRIEFPAGSEPPVPAKNPHAVALGKLGGPKGGKARAEKLSANRRREIAGQAAVARWKSSSIRKP